MKTSLTVRIGLAACAALVMTGVASAKVSPQTIENLNAAFQGESNAANRYGQFAAKADAEGHAQVAKLFRAAAVAESVHRDAHKQAILDLGGQVANFQLEAVTPGTTAENLQGAIKGESYERDTMYPGFIATAKADEARPAIRAMELARTAEAGHAKLYQQALDQLGKPGAPVDYYVCQVCGLTVTELPAKNCSSCHRPKDEYKKIA